MPTERSREEAPPPYAVGKRPTDAPSHPDIQKILLDQQTLRSRIRELGSQISRDYAGRRLLVVGVLKGSLIFMADLLRAIGAEVDVHVDFIAVSSYAGTASTGTIRVLLDLRENPEDAEELKELEAEAGECKDADEARHRIEEDALSVEVPKNFFKRCRMHEGVSVEATHKLCLGYCNACV